MQASSGAAARRIIDLTEPELAATVASAIAAVLAEPTREPVEPDQALTRKQTAGLLAVSLSQVDLLSRRERDPLPFYYVGESRRYIRSEALAWIRRQREVVS